MAACVALHVRDSTRSLLKLDQAYNRGGWAGPLCSRLRARIHESQHRTQLHMYMYKSRYKWTVQIHNYRHNLF